MSDRALTVVGVLAGAITALVGWTVVVNRQLKRHDVG